MHPFSCPPFSWDNIPHESGYFPTCPNNLLKLQSIQNWNISGNSDSLCHVKTLIEKDSSHLWGAAVISMDIFMVLEMMGLLEQAYSYSVGFSQANDSECPPTASLLQSLLGNQKWIQKLVSISSISCLLPLLMQTAQMTFSYLPSICLWFNYNSHCQEGMLNHRGLSEYTGTVWKFSMFIFFLDSKFILMTISSLGRSPKKSWPARSKRK